MGANVPLLHYLYRCARVPALCDLFALCSEPLTPVPDACVQPKTFGYHELFHAATIVASICHFSAVYILVHQNPEQLLHT